MSSYSYSEKLLHDLFLSDRPLSNFLYSRLISKSKKNKSNEKAKKIFITGLARAGTTAVLNNIYSCSRISSILYKHMPFILSPTLSNIYTSLSNSKYQISKERFHGDGIKISPNSPECLDEIFWLKSLNNIDMDSYKRNSLINSEILNGYSYFLDKFAFLQNQTSIVVKNNNNHQRLNSLLNFFNDDYFLLLIREPLSHASSLLNQHKRFLKIQKEDPYILEYMDLIGHNEFGTNLKPFLYDEESKARLSNYDPLNINYWLSQWVITHEWILNNNFTKSKNIFLISYEKLCSDKKYFPNILKKLNLQTNKSKVNFRLGNFSLKKEDKYEFDLFEEAKDIHSKIIDI